MNRIVITGPESTGKSRLAENLARHYNTLWVPEYAREYIATLNRPYNQDDIMKIAKKQLKQEEELAKKATDYLFADTSMIVIKIWNLFVYGNCPAWIDQQIDKHRYDLYLLCYIDTPWEYDPQREHPNARRELYNLYEQELKQRGLPYGVINGLNDKRLHNAIKTIDEHLIR